MFLTNDLNMKYCVWQVCYSWILQLSNIDILAVEFWPKKVNKDLDIECIGALVKNPINSNICGQYWIAGCDVLRIKQTKHDLHWKVWGVMGKTPYRQLYMPILAYVWPMELVENQKHKHVLAYLDIG